MTRQIPVQLLALEWLNKIDASIETRAYLVENFLPILVLGCEKVLKEAQLKNLLQDNKKDVNFVIREVKQMNSKQATNKVIHYQELIE